LNVMFRNLGCLKLWWLGVFIAPNHQGSRWGGCWRWAHRTDTVQCPVRRHVTQPLGFGVESIVVALSSCGTRQSDATPDSPVPSDFVALTSVAHCAALFPLSESTVVHWIVVARWLTGQFNGTPDSPVNYSGARLCFLESGWLDPVRSWCTGHCPVAHQTVWCFTPHHTQVLFAPFELGP
jgi:hypothetical protein